MEPVGSLLKYRVRPVLYDLCIRVQGSLCVTVPYHYSLELIGHGDSGRLGRSHLAFQLVYFGIDSGEFALGSSPFVIEFPRPIRVGFIERLAVDLVHVNIVPGVQVPLQERVHLGKVVLVGVLVRHQDLGVYRGPGYLVYLYKLLRLSSGLLCL